MCWYAYIATLKPLIGVLLSKDLPKTEESPPPLYFIEVTEYERKLYRPLFEGQYLYAVGTNTGCGCGLNRGMAHTSGTSENAAKIDYYNDASPSAFIEFVKTYTQRNALEMYVVWEDDRLEPPLEKTIVNVQDMTIDTYFKLKSRCFYTFFTT